MQSLRFLSSGAANKTWYSVNINDFIDFLSFLLKVNTEEGVRADPHYNEATTHQTYLTHAETAGGYLVEELLIN